MCMRRACAGTISANVSAVSVCLPVHTDTKSHTHTNNTKKTGEYMSSSDRKSFICTEGGKHNRTPTQAHTSRYSLHLRHVMESVGLHRRYSLGRKIQRTTLRGAGACAHERRTGVVAAEGAAAKGHCPCLGLDAGRQKSASRAQQLIPIKNNGPVGTTGCVLESVCVYK